MKGAEVGVVKLIPKWVGGHGGASPILQFFSRAPSHSKSMPPMGRTPHLKMKPPQSEKQTPPLKREATFHEMVPRKSTINNLKSS